MTYGQEILNQVKVQNLQSCESRDGYAYSGTFCIGKTKIAAVQNSGCGGDSMIDFTSKDTEATFNTFVADNNLKQIMADDYNKDAHFKKDWTADDFHAECILSHFMEEFMQIKAESQSISRWQKKGIIYGVRGSGSYQQMSWKHALVDIVKANRIDIIQNAYNKIKSELKENEVVLNTNLSKLGIEV